MAFFHKIFTLINDASAQNNTHFKKSVNQFA